jgi:hypothetical protein
MALHREIYWVGRQWAVTGYGIQACDQKQKGKHDIQAARIWEAGVLESVRAQKWLNVEDFDNAINVARKYYPEPPQKAAPLAPPPAAQPVASAPRIKGTVVKPPKPAIQKFHMRIEGAPAKFARTWRVRIRP